MAARQKRVRRTDARCEVTVGARSADIVGQDGRAIQLAVDAMAFRGGGTVRVLPGRYLLRDSIRMRPNVHLVGSPGRTVLHRGPLVWSPLAVDADTSETHIIPSDASGFREGMGVSLWDRRSGWSAAGMPYVVTGVADGCLRLDGHMINDRLAEESGVVVNYFPMILGIEAHGASVDGFECDASVDDPKGALAGMRIAVVYFWRSQNCSVRRVFAHHGLGDGICLAKSSTGAVVEDCETSHNDCYGIHPGSHSARCVIRRCSIHHNGSDGLYICWGIRHSEFTDNEIFENGWREFRSGISIGHKDTDNLIARNRIYRNRKFGVCVRRKTEPNGAHRGHYLENVIEDNGSTSREFAALKKRLEPWESIGCGFSVCGETHDLLLERNTIRETRRGAARVQRHAVCLNPGTSSIRMVDNFIEGHPGAAVVDNSGARDNELQ